ncbi:hypothetical protein BTVI_62665 [Pitangus sulphuratus]|nr:hypothetical protein BTVI_62665 [Pitangus sulphuratus]
MPFEIRWLDGDLMGVFQKRENRAVERPVAGICHGPLSETACLATVTRRVGCPRKSLSLAQALKIESTSPASLINTLHFGTPELWAFEEKTSCSTANRILLYCPKSSNWGRVGIDEPPLLLDQQIHKVLALTKAQ